MDQLLPEALRDYAALTYGGIALIAVVLVGAVLTKIARLFRRPAAKVDLEAHLMEDLRDLPPTPEPGASQLVIDGVPTRLRLVVLAPAGAGVLNPADAQAVLEGIRRGLGQIAADDEPRVVIWPKQLSQNGFAPRFHRLVKAPQTQGQPSPWVLLAGPARFRSETVLLGLALRGEESTTLGRHAVGRDDWFKLLSFSKTED